MMAGWIKLSRDLIHHPLWQEKPFTRAQAWVDLILITNYKDGGIRVAGEYIPIMRGQCGWSQLKLSHRWGWSRGKITRFLNELKTEQQIDIKTNTRNSIITICNYNSFQSGNDGDSTTESVKTVQQTEQQTEHYKEGKERKEVLKTLPLTKLDFSKWQSTPSPKVVADYKRARKSKLTQTAIDRMANEINKAHLNGLTADECLAVCCEAGWQGFKYDWFMNRENKNGKNRNANATDKHQEYLDRLKAL